MEKTTHVTLFDSTTKGWSQIRVPTPNPEGEEILVRVLGCTVCGSDLHSVAGRRSVPSPSVLGHEIVGEIIKFGPNAPRVGIDGQALTVGDRIVWCVVANCGECFYCQANLPQKCVKAIKYGHVRYDSPRSLLGGFSEHCLLVKGTKCIKLPAQIPLEIACPISCVTATAAAAIDSCRGVSGDNALILGAGLLGLLTCRMLRTQGVTQVVCVDIAANRRATAIEFGATHSVETLTSDLAVELTNGRGFDRVFECSGRNEAFEAGFEHIRIGGAMLLSGAVFPGPTTAVVLERIVRRNLTIVGIHNYAPKHLEQAVQFSMTEEIRVLSNHVVSQWFSLDRLTDAFDMANSAGSLRIGVRP
jgi:putative phosphonate catabolism associated alcohol dehydrogenase